MEKDEEAEEGKKRGGEERQAEKRVGLWQPLKQTPRSLHSPHNCSVDFRRTCMRVHHIQIRLSIKRDYDQMCYFLLLIKPLHTREVLDLLVAKPKTGLPIVPLFIGQRGKN